VNVTALLTASSTALFLELLLIRWQSSEIPVLAYFKNFPLLAVFTGLGLGCLMASAPRSRWRSSLWALAGLAAVIACAHRLHLDELTFPEAYLDVWSHPFDATVNAGAATSVAYLATIFAILALNAWAFVGLGQAIGSWLSGGPPLRVYAADLAGSLAGVIAFAALSWGQTPPAAWLATGIAGLAAVAWRLDRRRESVPPLAVLGLLAVLSMGGPPNALVVWSPYYRIQLTQVATTPPPRPEPLIFRLDVNRDFHQSMMDISDRREAVYRGDPEFWQHWLLWRLQYDFAYWFKKAPASVLIGGAGSGNNVAGALRNGAGKVTAVEIDPAIQEVGRQFHPLHPYDAPNVLRVNDDVRSFVRRSHETFDLIEYGILDSHTALSMLSSLRLENYVYTVEGLREAYARLAPDGVMVVSFHDEGRPWIGQRLYRNITLATGTPPVGTRLPEMAFFVFGPGAPAAAVRERLAQSGMPILDEFYAAGGVPASTDDWPFLYANPQGQPLVYYFALALLVVLGGGAIWLALRFASGGKAPAADRQMFFLGAGFLLIETKALAELSLLLGSTWAVNTFVFAGLLAMVLLANGAVALGAGRWQGAAWVLLALALVGWWAFPRAALNALPFVPRALLGTGLVMLPVLFAGVIFSTAFASRAAPATAFGWNLIGAMTGGALEALSLAVGLKALSFVALGLYALARLTAPGPPDLQAEACPRSSR